MRSVVLALSMVIMLIRAARPAIRRRMPTANELVWAFGRCRPDNGHGERHSPHGPTWCMGQRTSLHGCRMRFSGEPLWPP
jgi:hypothetical protein